MSSIGTGYDLAASTFSPDGRLFQVEYAFKAAEFGDTLIAVRSSNGMILATEKVIPSKLYKGNPFPRIFQVHDYIAMGITGNIADCVALKAFAIAEARKWQERNRQLIDLPDLVSLISEYMHIFTLGINRPFGVSIFLADWSYKHGSRLFVIEPNGSSYQCKAWAAGKHRQAAKAEIEKRKYLEEGDMSSLIYETVRMLIVSRDEITSKNIHIEMCWIGEFSCGMFMKLEDSIIEEGKVWTQKQLDEDDEEI